MRLIVIYLFTISLILQISVAKSEMCNGKVCISKCCENNRYVLGKKVCVPYDKLELSNFEVHNKNLSLVGQFSDYFEVKPGLFSDEKVRTESFYYLRFYSSFRLFENGSVSLQVQHSDKSDLFNPDSYCMDHLLATKGNTTIVKNIAVFIRVRQDTSQMNPIFFKYGFLVSCFFLFLVLLVYLLQPELRNLGGLILMAYVFSLLMAFLVLFCMQIGDGTFNITSCLVLTFLIYYFLMSSFFWMTIMSYDIWWTFRGYAKARPIHRRGERFKFGMYCLVAWGTPTLMTIVLAILNDTPPSRLPGIIKPEIPNKGCFLADKAKMVYMYMPMLIMILLNWTFFGMTVFNIWRLSRGTKILSNQNSSASGTAAAHRMQRHRLVLYLKLSVVMGLNWLLEVVSSFYPESPFWYVTDTYNIFIGLIIFLIFVCKRKVYKKLKKRCCHSSALPKSSILPSELQPWTGQQKNHETQMSGPALLLKPRPW